MKRTEARQRALQALFQLDSTELTIEEAMQHALSVDDETEAKTNAFFEQLVRGTTENLEAIDASLNEKLEKWTHAFIWI